MSSTKAKTKVVILKLSPKLLAPFAGITMSQESATPSSNAQSPAPTPNDPVVLKTTDSADAASETNSTPAPLADDANPSEQLKKKKGPGAGAKRTANSLTADGLPKPRGKPGPKKKPRLEDGTIDHSAKPSAAAGAGHKLGPKANQGAINAGLRALDRSGKPCRKWAKRSFQVKSFTGIIWDLHSWKGGDKAVLLNGDDSSDVKDVSQQSNSELKPNNDSDVAMSNTGDVPVDSVALSTPAASSPPPAPAPEAPPAIIAAQG